jgi:crotonobetainyl-CoA:carnitine CoA-transferase CaiB-like acyl-CoA transferase
MNDTGPLRGIRVLDLSIAATGPYAAAMMADQGADVIKIERPGVGDIARYIGVQVEGISALYQICNRGKRSVALDLSSEEGRDVAHRLAATCDVVMQNWRPGVAEKLGVGYEDLKRDDLVYVSVSAFGDEGPYATRGAYDTVIQAAAGVADAQADPGTGAPEFVRQVMGDKVTALTVSQAVTAALFARERGDGGQHVKLSMLDAVVSFLWIDCAGNEVLRDGDGSQPRSFSSLAVPISFTDGYGMVTPTSDHDFVGMCKAFGVEGHDDPKVKTATLRQQNRDRMAELIGGCYVNAAGMTTAEAVERMEAERVPYGLVQTPAGLADDPQAQAIGLLVDDVHPVAGRIRQPRHPILFEATPAELGGPAPIIGQHTDSVLGELGLAEADITALRESGAIA